MMPEFEITFVSLIFLLIVMFVDVALKGKTMKETQVLALMLTSFVPYLQYCVLAFIILQVIKSLTSK